MARCYNMGCQQQIQFELMESFSMASSSVSSEQVFIGPGLSLFKRIVTILSLVGLVALVLWIAIYQHNAHDDASVIGSTIAAVLFIGGFTYYLMLIAPVPFTITLSSEGVNKRNRRGETIRLTWDELTKVKEEFFPNGKRIGITLYRKVTQPGQKAKAWAVYRDDVTDLDGLAHALKHALPETCVWQSETVHE
jgi:YD repeat-containing protein